MISTETQRIETQFGIAIQNKYGYYQIKSRKEGNHNKYLHRLIFENFYGIKLLSNIHIHHLDEDKSNNEIWNLIPMTKQEHNSLHKSKLNHENLPNDFYNPTGFFNVTKHKDSRCKQGFNYRYVYFEDNTKKYIHSISLDKLEMKVKELGLEWRRLDV